MAKAAGLTYGMSPPAGGGFKGLSRVRHASVAGYIER
jgi:hypothetical protein